MIAEIVAQIGASPGALAFAFAAVTLGTVVQRLSGQAFGMIAAPLVALAVPQVLPAALLLLGIVVGFGASAMDLSALDRRELVPGMAGRLAGGLVGAALAARIVSAGAVELAVAAVVLLAVALSLSGLRVPIRAPSLVLAGIAAGIMGTLTAIGAPPMALLYQHEPARRARAMQNAFFFWGMVVSVAALWAYGLVTATHLAFAALMLPAVLLGLALSAPLARHTERWPIRPAALGLSTAAALALIVRSAGG